MMSSQMSHTIDDDDDLGVPDNPFMSVNSNPIPSQQQQQQQQPTPLMQQPIQIPDLHSQSQGGAMNMNNAPTIPINDNSFQPVAMNNDTMKMSGNMDGGNNNKYINNANNGSSDNGISLPVPSVFSFQTYASYFNVDTVDIQNRITGSIVFVNKPNHFREQVLGGSDGKGPDLYGPLWITITLVFVIALTSNLFHYIQSGTDRSNFDYDIGHLVNASFVLFGFVFWMPTLNYVLFRCVGVSCFMWTELLCLYGYSMTAFFPAAFMCLVPMWGWAWTVLLIATGLSALLVLRNVAGPILQTQQSQQKAGPILIFIMVTHFILYLLIKLMFYNHHSSGSDDSSTASNFSPTSMPTISDQSGD